MYVDITDCIGQTHQSYQCIGEDHIRNGGHVYEI